MSRKSPLRLAIPPKPPTKRTSAGYRRYEPFQQRWRRTLHYFYLRFIRLRGSPEAIARGLAAGVFAGLFPFIATQTLIAILLAAIVRGNKIVAAAATWISNPFTAFPIYAFNFQIGRWLLGSDNLNFNRESFNSWEAIMALGTEFVADLLLGCLVVASISAVASYFLSLWFVRRIRSRRKTNNRVN